ncbi:MAG: hypothetical protein U1B80_01970 [Anaerolineaceae bacterium]|nr:hypothetical protein [Anaerolineaceae bacterium]
MNDKPSPQPAQPTSPGNGSSHSDTILPLLAAGISILMMVILVWFSIPLFRSSFGMVSTPTLHPSATITPRPTRTPTVTPSPTPAPTSTLIPLPTSAYQLHNLVNLYPPVPGLQGTAVVLNDDTNLTVSPEFSHPQWSHSSTIEAQIGYEILEPYYATYGSGSAIWMMDVPVARGVYEIYILDTLYSSAGALDFMIRLGETPIQPLLGSTNINFLSTRFDPRQTEDLWRYLGLYLIDEPGWLSVSTSWLPLDENSIVAIDRVLVVRLPDSTRQLLDLLPKERLTFIVDDSNAEIQFTQVLYTEDTPSAWGESFQYAINPADELSVNFTLPELVPPGQYEVRVWIPEEHATAEVSFSLLVNGTSFASDTGSDTLILRQRDAARGQWVSLGTWTTPRIYEFPVKLSLTMQAKAGVTGDVAIDAVAFLKIP